MLSKRKKEIMIMAVRIVKHEDTIAVRCPDLTKGFVSHNTKKLITVQEKKCYGNAHIAIANGEKLYG